MRISTIISLHPGLSLAAIGLYSILQELLPADGAPTPLLLADLVDLTGSSKKSLIKYIHLLEAEDLLTIKHIGNICMYSLPADDDTTPCGVENTPSGVDRSSAPTPPDTPYISGFTPYGVKITPTTNQNKRNKNNIYNIISDSDLSDPVYQQVISEYRHLCRMRTPLLLGGQAYPAAEVRRIVSSRTPDELQAICELYQPERVQHPSAYLKACLLRGPVSMRPARSQSPVTPAQGGSVQTSHNKFHNFPERQYDFDELEKRLLARTAARRSS